MDQIYSAWQNEGGTDDSINIGIDNLIKSTNKHPIFAQFLENRNLIDFIVTSIMMVKSQIVMTGKRFKNYLNQSLICNR